jgi:hypothetical protein
VRPRGRCRVTTRRHLRFSMQPRRAFICWGMEAPLMKRGKRGQRKKFSPKQSLNLPDLDQAKSAVLNGLPSKEPQRGYRHAIDEFINWYCSEPRLSFKKAVVRKPLIFPRREPKVRLENWKLEALPSVSLVKRRPRNPHGRFCRRP